MSVESNPRKHIHELNAFRYRGVSLLRNIQLAFEVTGGLEISEGHKAIVRDRIKKSDQNPERLLDWEQVQDNFQLD